MFLITAVLVTLICLTSGRDPISGYSAPESTQYYAEHPDALADELEKNVFPALSDYELAASVSADGKVIVTVDSDSYVPVRAALLQYFDVSLLEFNVVDHSS